MIGQCPETYLQLNSRFSDLTPVVFLNHNGILSTEFSELLLETMFLKAFDGLFETSRR